jgi:hypothetical protein
MHMVGILVDAHRLVGMLVEAYAWYTIGTFLVHGLDIYIDKIHLIMLVHDEVYLSLTHFEDC